MMGESHELVEDFPEYREQIHALYLNDLAFARLFGAYNDVNREVIRIEQGLENPSSVYTEELKKRRVVLKDQLYARLQEAAAA